jgi:hypothetical protein
MRRREFIGLLGSAAAAWPLLARAQASVPRLGMLLYSSAEGDPSVASLKRGLAKLGYVEGRNIAIEYRFAESRLGWIGTKYGHDRDGRRCQLVGYPRTLADCNDQIDMAFEQFFSKCWHPIELASRPSVFDRNVLPFGKASFAQSPS